MKDIRYEIETAVTRIRNQLNLRTIVTKYNTVFVWVLMGETLPTKVPWRTDLNVGVYNSFKKKGQLK